MDAILFSAKPSMVDMDDAINHLENHKELYWSIGVHIREKFSFPIFGFIHITGRQVEYRALISDIIPFSPEQYDDPAVEPEAWRQRWKNDPSTRAYQWKSVFVMTEIVPFSFDTRSIEKCGGGLIKLPPQKYVRVLPPNQSRETALALPSRSIAEKNLEDFVVEQLETVEAGLCLVSRQLSTPAGRLDLLCKDALGNYVVVELKKSQGGDQVVGQILRYMGWVKEKYPKSNVRGIVIVGKKDDALRYAIAAAPNIEAKEFKLSIA